MRNEFQTDGDITRVFMTMKDGTLVTAIIDTEDIPKVAPYRWHAAKQRDGYRIVCHMRKNHKGPKEAFYMHRIVMDAPPKVFVDHINCDPSDNRKSNLRFTDFKGNGQNRKHLHPTNTSGVKNVTWHKRDQKWQAAIKLEDRTKYLGYFTELAEAERAVVAARAKYMPYSQEALLCAVARGEA